MRVRGRALCPIGMPAVHAALFKINPGTLSQFLIQSNRVDCQEDSHKNQELWQGLVKANPGEGWVQILFRINTTTGPAAAASSVTHRPNPT